MTTYDTNFPKNTIHSKKNRPIFIRRFFLCVIRLGFNLLLNLFDRAAELLVGLNEV